MGSVEVLDPRQVRQGRMEMRAGGMMAGEIRGIRRRFRAGGGRHMMRGMGALRLTVAVEGVVGRFGKYKNRKDGCWVCLVIALLIPKSFKNRHVSCAGNPTCKQFQFLYYNRQATKVGRE